MKPGYKTTEFWLTLFAAIAPFFGASIDPTTAQTISAGVVAAYAVARGIAKKQ